MKYELTFRKRDELELLWQALYKAHCDTTEKEKYTELMKKVGSVLEREQILPDDIINLRKYFVWYYLNMW